MSHIYIDDSSYIYIDDSSSTCGTAAHPYTANPTWGDIFERCFKAQSSKLERLFSLKRGKRDVRALSFRKCHPKWDWLYICLPKGVIQDLWMTSHVFQKVLYIIHVWHCSTTHSFGWHVSFIRRYRNPSHVSVVIRPRFVTRQPLFESLSGNVLSLSFFLFLFLSSSHDIEHLVVSCWGHPLPLSLSPFLCVSLCLYPSLSSLHDVEHLLVWSGAKRIHHMSDMTWPQCVTWRPYYRHDLAMLCDMVTLVWVPLCKLTISFCRSPSPRSCSYSVSLAHYTVLSHSLPL